MKITKKLPAEQPNHGGVSPARQFVVLGTSLIIFVVAVYLAGEAIISRGIVYIPQNWEHRLFSRVISANLPLADDARNPQVQALLDRIVKVTPEVSLPLTLKVISDEVPNAMALPGGLILVTDELLKEAQSENEISMVLAHEVGHFTLRHHLRRVGRSLVLPTLSALVFGDASVSALVTQSSALVELSYSRNEELAADSFALDTLNRVYGHVGGATDFFERVAGLELNLPGGKYVSSHPVSEERIQALHSQIRANRYQSKASIKKDGAL
jgi:predicted Zn-dependent protease